MQPIRFLQSQWSHLVRVPGFPFVPIPDDLKEEKKKNIQGRISQIYWINVHISQQLRIQFQVTGETKGG